MAQSQPEVFFAAIVLLFGATLGLFLAVTYYKTLAGIIRENRVKRSTVRPGGPHEVPNLNLEALDHATSELTGLGFEFLGDFVTVTPPSSPTGRAPIALADARPTPVPELPEFNVKSRGFMRVYTHPVHNCCAKIIGVVVTSPGLNGVPRITSNVSTAMVSYQGLELSDWNFSTTTNPARPTQALMRHPRRLSNRVVGGSAQELLTLHLERRETIARAAGVTWMKSYTPDDVILMETRSSENIRAVFGRLTPLKMAVKLFVLNRDRRQEWLGELSGKI